MSIVMSVHALWIFLFHGGALFLKNVYFRFKYFWYKYKCLVFWERILNNIDYCYTMSYFFTVLHCGIWSKLDYFLRTHTK